MQSTSQDLQDFAENLTKTFPKKVEDNLAVWQEFKDLTITYDCLSLGEGAPAMGPPQFLVDELLKAVQDGHNEYTRSFGHPLLVQKLAEVYGPKLGRQIDPQNEILVGPGGVNVISNILTAYLNHGDEVIVFEPGWPMYIDFVQYAGGKYRACPLIENGNKFEFSAEEFRKVINSNTKVLIINNAQNPTGKLFTREELQEITQILQEYSNVIILSDDVYEYLAYEGEYITIASIGDNFKRTITCYDGGKLFNSTGWTVAWAIGPSYLVKPVGLVTTTTLYCANSICQVAIANAFDKISEPNFKDGLSYLDYQKSEFIKVRDYITQTLLDNNLILPLIPLSCDSGFFIIADISQCRELIPERFKNGHDFEETGGKVIINKNRYLNEDGKVPLDLAFCRWIATTRGVVMMPCSLFYNKTSEVRSYKYVRIAICKGIEFSTKVMEKLYNLPL